MNTKQILVWTWTRLCLPHYGCRGSGRTQHSPLHPRWRHLRRQHSEVQLPRGHHHWVCVRGPAGSPCPCASVELEGENRNVSRPILVGTSLGTSGEHLARGKGSLVGDGSSPSVGASRLSCCESRPRQPSVCETGRQECDRPAWW